MQFTDFPQEGLSRGNAADTVWVRSHGFYNKVLRVTESYEYVGLLLCFDDGGRGVRPVSVLLLLRVIVRSSVIALVFNADELKLDYTEPLYEHFCWEHHYRGLFSKQVLNFTKSFFLNTSAGNLVNYYYNCQL